MNVYKQFKGTSAEYDALHYWVHRHLGKPQGCENCGTTKERRYDWANISGDYLYDLSDWARLCVRCHAHIDGKAKAYCKRGHEQTPDNSYVNPSTNIRACLKCKKWLARQNWIHRNPRNKQRTEIG